MTIALLHPLRMAGLALLFAVGLAACQTMQPAAAPTSGLNAEQIATLRDNGFVETDDGWALSFADQLLFDFASSDVRNDLRQRIGRISTALLAVGIDRARVEGHTDSVGSAAHNQRLSLSRAQAVASIIAASGFAADQLAVRGWGETRPVADNGTEQGRAENRRVVIIVTSL